MLTARRRPRPPGGRPTPMPPRPPANAAVTEAANSPPRPRITASFYGEALFYERADEAYTTIAAHLPPADGGPFTTHAHPGAYQS